MARSRRTTPSAQTSVPASTVPAGRGRVSRSRTHEPAPAPATQPAHSTRRSTRAKSVDITASAANNAPRTRRRVDAPQEIQQVDLMTVAEGSDDEDVDLEIPPPDGVPEVRATPGQDLDDPVGDRSLHSMSGTTVRSDHQSEDGDEDPHTLLTHGPAVYRAATDLIKIFNHRKPELLQLLNGIDEPNSSAEESFSEAVDILNDAVLQLGEAYGNGSNLIAPDHVMEALFKQSLPHMTSECWHVTELMQLLNLAIITRRVASTPTETADMAQGLRKLDVQFPIAFLKNLNMSDDSAHIVGNSYLRDETFEVALAIRVQTTVMEIQRGFNADDFDVGDFVQGMFFAIPGKQDNLRAWDVNGLGSGDLGLLPEYDVKMRRTIKHLLSCVEYDTQNVADGSEDGMQTLTRNFPWSEFRAIVLRWATLRTEEITSSINDAGGVEKLMDEVRAELSKDPSFNPDAVSLPPRSPAKQKAGAVADRTELRQASVSDPISSPLRSTNGNAARNRRIPDDEPTFESIEEVEGPLDPYIAATLYRIDEAKKQRKENIRQQPSTIASSIRRRHYVDEQEDAERITNFEDSTQPSPSRGEPRNPPQSNHPKRKRRQSPVDEDDVTEDDGFGTDTREIDMSQRRREAPRPGPSPKKVRIQEPDQENRAAPRRRSPDVQGTPVREFATQKQISRSQAARATQSSPRRHKVRQVRKQWSPAQELRLEEYVSEYGISWAYLKELDKEEGDMFEGRDQVALKDKARNMKTQMILHEIDPLPRNWELVPLDKKAIDRLIRGGVDDDRLERAGINV